MARETVTKEIDGKTYLVRQMDAIKATKVQTKLLKLIGPGIAKMQVDKSGSILNTDGTGFDISKVLPMLQSLLEHVNDELLFNFIMMLFEEGVMLQGTTREGQKVPVSLDFKEHFAGTPITMWKVIGFILEVNFGLGKLIESASLTT